MEIVFHMGAPRAGSSAIQKALGSRFEDVGGVDFEQSRYCDSLLSRYLRIYAKSPNSKLLAHWMSFGLKLLLSMRERQGGRRLILSDEILAGEMLGKAERLFQRIDLIYTAVKGLRRRHDCKMVIIIRRQEEYINSCYRFRVERGERRSITEFVGDIDRANLLWKTLLDKAEEYGLLEQIYLVDFDSVIKKGMVFEKLPVGFDERLVVPKLNSSARLAEVYSFMRQVTIQTKVKQCRAAVLERKMIDEDIGLVSAASLIYGDQSWISRCHELAMEHCIDGVFSDVTMGVSDSEEMVRLTEVDKRYLLESSRCFGDFTCW